MTDEQYQVFIETLKALMTAVHSIAGYELKTRQDPRMKLTREEADTIELAWDVFFDWLGESRDALKPYVDEAQRAARARD